MLNAGDIRLRVVGDSLVKRIYLVFAGLCGAIVLIVSSAHAHSEVIRAQQILYRPGNPAYWYVQSDAWGSLFSLDGGETWGWVCAEVHGDDSYQANRWPTVFAADGALVMAREQAGLFVGLEDGCSWTRVALPVDYDSVVDVTTVDGGETVFALATKYQAIDGGFRASSHLFSSLAVSASWSARKLPLPERFFPNAIRFAPSDTSEIYASGYMAGEAPTSGEPIVVHSEDAGATWIPHVVDFDVGGPFSLVTVAPGNASQLVARINRVDEVVADSSPDTVLLSEDSGSTWTRVFDGDGGLPGVALSPDGNVLYVAGPYDGLWGADVEHALRAGQSAFQQINDQVGGALLWTGGMLVAGLEPWRHSADNGLPLVGTSRNGGISFDVQLDICNIDFGACAAKGATIPCNGEPIEAFRSDLLRVCARQTPDASVLADAGASSPIASHASAQSVDHRGRGCQFGGWTPRARRVVKIWSFGLSLIIGVLRRYLGRSRRWT